MARTPENLQFIKNVSPHNPDAVEQILDGLSTRIYRPYLGRMLDYGVGQIRDGILDPQATSDALVTASELYVAADQDYHTQSRPISDRRLGPHQANVLGGNIVLVNERSQVTLENSQAQVERADQAFYNQTSDSQAVLADLNYGTVFRSQTMASASHTLGRKELDKLLAVLGKDQTAMPHLTASNWAIGQLVAGAYKFASESELHPRMRIFDIGSGQGATLAAIINSIGVESVEEAPEISITGLETTSDFYSDLAEFVEGDNGARTLGLTPVRFDPMNGDPISRPGTVTTVRGDAATVLNAIDYIDGPQINVFDANYSFHRLGRRKKMEILGALHNTPNVLFVVGDLMNNTSPVNRRYFNLGVNGPLNAGNLYLPELFQSYGFEIVDLAKERPASLDPRLTDRLTKDSAKNDGHLWIAHRGKLAAEALQLQTA